MQRLVISAPFGNYLNYAYCTPTVGTYTCEYRGNFWTRLWRVLLTVRYYPGIQGVKNRLRLPNPGIADLKHRWQRKEIYLDDKIVSVLARTTENWCYLIFKVAAMKPRAIELNVSCPNIAHDPDATDYLAVYKTVANLPETELIVKLPPVEYERHVELAYYAGIRSFHACNTLPTPGGGLSGKPLKPLSLACVRYLKSYFPECRIIGGGGITCMADAAEYLNAGATNVAVASVLFNPFLHRRIRKMATDLATQLPHGYFPQDFYGSTQRKVEVVDLPGTQAAGRTPHSREKAT